MSGSSDAFSFSSLSSVPSHLVFGNFDDELDAALQPGLEDIDDGQETQPQGTKPRRKARMSDRDRLEFLRWLKSRNLALSSILRALFPSDPQASRSADFNPAPDAPSSSPSAYSSTDHSLYYRIQKWLSGDGPTHFAERWKGMDQFAIQHVAKMVRSETSRAITDPYLKGPAAKDVTNKVLRDYTLAKAADVAAQRCPVLQEILDAAVGEASQNPADDEEEQDQANPQDDPDWNGEEEDAEREGAIGQGGFNDWKGRWGFYGQRSKGNVSTTALHLLLFGRNKTCNMFQLTMGLLFYAGRVGKRVIEILARGGMSVSWKTIQRLSSALADDAMKETRAMVQRSDTFITLSIDNLNWMSSPRDKTTLRKSHMEAATVGNLYVVDDQVRYDSTAPICSPALFEDVFGPELEKPTTEPRTVSPLDDNGRPAAMNREARDAYRSRASEADIDMYDFVPTLEEHKHLTQCIISHAQRAWIEMHPEADFEEQPDAPSQVFPLVPKKSTVLPLPVYDHNEGTIQGNIDVLEAICKDLGLDDADLAQRIMSSIGDAFTATLQRKAVQRREDDRSDTPHHDRLQYLQVLAAFFHYQYAYQKYLSDTHAGTAVAQDLLSMRRMSSVAGYKNLFTGNLDFHDADAFFHTYFKSLSDLIISSALRKAGHGDQSVPGGGDDIGDETLVEGDETVVEHEMDLDPDDPERLASGVESVQLEPRHDQSGDDGNQGQQAIPVEEDVPQLREQAMAMPEGGRRTFRHSEREFAKVPFEDFVKISTEAVTNMMRGSVLDSSSQDDHIDLLFSHGMCLFRDLAVYMELRHATKHGDPGRIFAVLRQCLPRFQAGGQHRYVVETMEMLYQMKYELPPPLRTAMMAATLVNHSGRPDGFFPVDLDIEHIVFDCKNTFPVQAKAGGEQRQRRIGELLPTLRAIKNTMYQAYSITSVDTTRRRADTSFTSTRLSSELEEYAVLERQTRGRESSVFDPRKIAKRPKKKMPDTFTTGIDGLIGTSTRAGAIQTFIDQRRSNTSDAIIDGLEEEAAGTHVDVNIERDMGGFNVLPSDLSV